MSTDLAGDDGQAAVVELCELLEANEPLSVDDMNEIERLYKQVARIDFLAPEHVQKAQTAKVREFAERVSKSSLKQTLSEAWKPANKQNLRIHAENLINHFKAMYITGDPPPPGSSNRVAIILRKQKADALERRFVFAWSRHFSNLDERASKLRET